MIQERLDKARALYDTLQEREKKLIIAMLAVAACLVLVLPLILLGAKVHEHHAQTHATQALISEIASNQQKYQEMRAERQRKQQLYSNPAPALGSFMEDLTQRFGLSMREAEDQPAQTAQGFAIRSMRVTLNNAGIKPIIDLIAAIKNSGNPVVVERIQLESSGAAGNFDARLTISAYDKSGASQSAPATPETSTNDYESTN